MKYARGGEDGLPEIYRSVPEYTEDVLQSAEQKAKAYIDAGIKINNFTKAEVIKVSGQERANFLYYNDGRIVSGIQEEVDAVFIETARELLCDNDYVLPEEILPTVREKINEMYWIDPFDENRDPEETRHFNQAQRALRRLPYRYDELSKEIPCQYKEFKREEKTALQLPLYCRKKFYVK